MGRVRAVALREQKCEVRVTSPAPDGVTTSFKTSPLFYPPPAPKPESSTWPHPHHSCPHCCGVCHSPLTDCPARPQGVATRSSHKAKRGRWTDRQWTCFSFWFSFGNKITADGDSPRPLFTTLHLPGHKAALLSKVSNKQISNFGSQRKMQGGWLNVRDFPSMREALGLSHTTDKTR